ncbi:uncharacterized protein LOC135475650 [Liolophura sinensis]|uniref:uncharacterized protein LOC135475650 n=1 Tax=Liolophura sinensis TaxID=3198878 RepID=UPI0031599445
MYVEYLMTANNLPVPDEQPTIQPNNQATQATQATETMTDPAAYSGVQPLLKAARQRGLKVSRTHVSAWLAQQDTYTLHRPARRHYPRNRVVVGGIDSQWQADLVDMTAFAKENDNNRYLLTCIDVLSRYAWVMPLRAKTGARLIEPFQQIFKTGRRPLYLQTDEGKKFLNRPFQAFLKDNGVFFFHTFNETKASVVERLNRTLKGRMYKFSPLTTLCDTWTPYRRWSAVTIKPTTEAYDEPLST